MNKKIFILGVFLLLSTVLLLSQKVIKKDTGRGNYRAKVLINGKTFRVEIADNQETQVRGLSGRKSMSSDAGMLFVYPKVHKSYLWMKQMYFPLDFIWIRGETVVDITEDVPAPSGSKDDDLPIYSSFENIDKILEVNAGVVKNAQIKIGDKISIEK